MSGLVITVWLFGMMMLALYQPVVGPILYYLIVWLHPEEQMYGGLSLRWTMLIALTSLVGYLFLGKQRQYPKNTLAPLLIIFSLWYLVCALVNGVSDAEFTLAADFAKIVLMCLVTASVINTRIRIHILIWIIVIAIGSVSLRTGAITLLGGGGHPVVGPSFLGHTNELARFVIYTFPLMLFLSRHSAHKHVRAGFAVLAVFSVFALIGTNSRGAFVAFAAMGAVFWLYSSRKLISVLLVAVITVSAYLAVPQARLDSFLQRTASIENAEEDSSFLGRTESWQFGWNYVQNKPVFGGGPGVYERVHGKAAHSSYFEVLGETGFVGLTMWGMIAVLVFSTIYRVRKLTRGIPELAWAHDLAFFIMISLVGYFVGGITKNHGINEYYYMLIGLLMGIEIAVLRYLTSLADKEAAGSPLPELRALQQR
jgi:probable O-glycosylation ligase (exosortase A-associated)